MIRVGCLLQTRCRDMEEGSLVVGNVHVSGYKGRSTHSKRTSKHTRNTYNKKFSEKKHFYMPNINPPSFIRPSTKKYPPPIPKTPKNLTSTCRISPTHHLPITSQRCKGCMRRLQVLYLYQSFLHGRGITSHVCWTPRDHAAICQDAGKSRHGAWTPHGTMQIFQWGEISAPINGLINRSCWGLITLDRGYNPIYHRVLGPSSGSFGH